MKKLAEIKRILTEELGFTDLAAYKRWVQDVRPGLTPTPERVERLSPDGIDNRDFWRVCEELFGKDPVANVVVPTAAGAPPAIGSHMDANRSNLRLAKTLGVTAFLDEFAERPLKTLEIGPGFGSLKNYIETHTRHVYTGVDVFPRVPDVLEASAEGLLPAGFVDKERELYSYVVSSNVFQHLSAQQRTQYYRDAQALLRKGGLFIVNLRVDTGKQPPNTRDARGDAWCDHYGQYTLLPKGADVYAELGGMFDILYVTQRYDALFNFVCQKRA